MEPLAVVEAQPPTQLLGDRQAVRKVAPKTLSLQELKDEELTGSTAFVQALDEAWVLGLTSEEKRQFAVIHAKFRLHPLRIFQR